MANPLLVFIPIALLISVVLLALIRSFAGIWLRHAMRLALLEEIEKKPELVEPLRELLDLVPGSAEKAGNRQDYRVTGTILAGIGAGSVIGGLWMHIGRVAVGIYIGGFLCIGIAVLFVLYGFIAARFRTSRRRVSS